MSLALPIANVGLYLLDELVRARDLHTTPDGQALRPLRDAELTIAFATADRLPIEPAIIEVGSLAMTIEEVRRELAPLQRKVLLSQQELRNARQTTRGTLILRARL